MPLYSSLSIFERLYVSKETLVIIQEDPLISAKLFEFGYSPARLEEGLSIQSAAQLATRQREDYFGQQLLATKARNELFRKIRSQFTADRRIVREVLAKDRASYQKYGLNTQVQDSRETVITQAQLFYNEVLISDSLLEALQIQFMMPAALFQQRLAQLTTLEEAMLKQQVQQAEAKLMTRRKREAMHKLDTWMGMLIAIARRAFRDDPKQLEKLGISVKAS